MKENGRITALLNSKFYPLLLFIVSFVFVTLFSRSTSFLYITEGGDPSVFKQMGLAILKGKTLFVDYFDNKGCILYFINALGLWLGNNFAIMLMQCVSLTITLIIWDKMLKLYHEGRSRFICMGIALLLLLCFYTEGDLTQEWCLPFASYPLLVYFRYIKDGRQISSLHMFLIGLCFGIITFIQINNATPFLGFIAYLWIRLLYEKKYSRFFSSFLCFFTGMTIIILACIFYFYYRAGWHGVYEMFYASFLSNFEYIKGDFENPIHYVVFYGLFLFSFLLFSIFSCRKREVLIPILISMALYVISYGKLGSIYYLMAFMPLCIVGLMVFNFSEKKRIKIALIGLSSISLTFYLSKPVHLFVNDIIMRNEKEVAIYNDFHDFIETVPEVERDSIYNYNLIHYGTSLMQHEELIQCNRVLFTSLAFRLPTLHQEEVSKPLSPPKWIMLSWNFYIPDDDAVFIMENYELKHTITYDRLYLTKPKIGRIFDISFYCRKE